MILLVLSVACTSPGPAKEVPATEDGVVSDTRAWQGEVEVVDPEPEWTVEEAGAEVEAFFSQPLATCRDVMAAFQEARGYADADAVEGCPRTADPEGLNELAGCTAESGYGYQGIADWDWEVTVDGPNVTTNGHFWTDFTITDPEGRAYVGGGECNYEAVADTDAGTETVSTDLLGSWIVEWSPTRLGLGMSTVMDATMSGSRDAPTLAIDGGLGLGEDYVSFEGFTWNGACAGGPAGAIDFRGDGGYWYTFDFGVDCDTCADVTFHLDDTLGQACPDLAPAVEGLVRTLSAPVDPSEGPTR